MITKSVSFENAYEFALALCMDDRYLDPYHHIPEDLWAAVKRCFEREDRDTFCITSGDGIITGLFSFLKITEESYLESVMVLSDDSGACREMWNYLVEQYPGWQCDFVFNPRNNVVTDLLRQKEGVFEIEQISMRYEGNPAKLKTPECIVPYEAKYISEYCALHSTDVWWTAERVLENPETFTVFIAVDGEKVVGYIDVSHASEEALISDIRVAKEFRNRGYGRKLLQYAQKEMKENGEKCMTLQVDTVNEAAKHLYGKCGFLPVEKENTITVHTTLFLHPDK